MLYKDYNRRQEVRCTHDRLTAIYLDRLSMMFKKIRRFVINESTSVTKINILMPKRLIHVNLSCAGVINTAAIYRYMAEK